MEVGDIVQLNSGGPKMTVTRILTKSEENIRIGDLELSFKLNKSSGGDVRCQWFEGERLKEGTFHRDALKMVS